MAVNTYSRIDRVVKESRVGDMMQEHEFAGRPGWFRERAGPGAPVSAQAERVGEAAFIVGVQAGMVDKYAGDLWYVFVDPSGYLWTAFESPEVFVQWNGASLMPKVAGRLNFHEIVPPVARFVFDVRQVSTEKTGLDDIAKDVFFRFIADEILPWIGKVFRGEVPGFEKITFRSPDVHLLANWCFLDTSGDTKHAFRAYSQTVKMTESARNALAGAMKFLRDEWLFGGYDVDFHSHSTTWCPVALPKCIDTRVPGSASNANDPVRHESVMRMATGQHFALHDFFPETGSYTALASARPSRP